MAANAEGCAERVVLLSARGSSAMCYIKYWYEIVKIKMWFIKTTLEYPLDLTTEVCGKQDGVARGYYYCWEQHLWYRAQGVK
jgi:hypothetical protein